MASLTDAFNDAFGEDMAMVKIIVYAIPVSICANLFLIKSFVAGYFFAIPTLILMATLMSNGICNIRSNKREILTFNIISLISVTIKLIIAVLPILCLMMFIGYCIVTFVKFPFDIPNFTLIFNCIVWLIVFSVIFTSYLAFSKTLNIFDAYNIKVISESSMDVCINLLFLIPQLLIANGIFIGAVWYLFFVFKLPLNSILFVFYCSCVGVLNLSALSSYFAQASYELIKGKDSEYQDNYYMKGSGMNMNNRKK
ncbi:hypothetical protein IJ674_08215 [bacterium]|jgi:hypothetical protein|nr:hypothetical protein [bacterium]